MTRRALMIANKRSRRCGELCEDAFKALRDAGFELTIPDLPDKSKLTEMIAREAPGHDCIIVMGGDGSINAALPGVLESKLPLGILPAGTANDLARTLNLPTDIADAARVIAEGFTKPIDVGSVNGHPFLNAASMGMSVNITRQLNRGFKRRWGVFAYVIAACKALWHARPFAAEIRNGDDKTIVRSVQIVVGNGRYFGTGMTVHEKAEIDDGRLRLYSVNIKHWWSFLTLLPALRRGTHGGDPRVFQTQGLDLSVITKRPRSVSADGELLTQTPARFTESPGALMVYVPPETVEKVAEAAGEAHFTEPATQGA